jgi:hypothetical protein
MLSRKNEEKTIGEELVTSWSKQEKKHMKQEVVELLFSYSPWGKSDASNSSCFL